MHINSYVPCGADGIIIRVEADIRRGIPGIDITGLAEGAVREARERVRAAFRNSGFVFPADRILINLAPAGVRKEGAALDLPIAVSVMAAAGIIPAPENIMVLGELELSGRLRPVRGVLAATAAGFETGIRDFIVPDENAAEAAIINGISFFPAATLCEAVHALKVRAETGALPENNFCNNCSNMDDFGPRADTENFFDEARFCGDFSEVQGQARYKRALEIAAAGGHNLFVFGPPGSGKTMLARRIPSIMPLLEPDEAVEVTKIHSLAGQLLPESGGLIRRPPFRSPHHSASAEGILGGGRFVRPGEISLAHRGVLFLDEAPEFKITVLQSLREPLEDRVITIARAEGPVLLPAHFQLILASNSCPCGRLGAGGSGKPECFCSVDEIRRYWRKIGGALLDRIELRVFAGEEEHVVGSSAHTNANRANVNRANANSNEETSAEIAARVLRAVNIQRERFKNTHAFNNTAVIEKIITRRNAGMTPALIGQFCVMTERAEQALDAASRKLGFSGRACHGVMRTARTIADLDGQERIDVVHVLEAVEHRRYGDDPLDFFMK